MSRAPAWALCLLAAVTASLTAATALEGPPIDQVNTLIIGGLTRTYRLHVPAGTAPAPGRPLVLLLHGHGGTAAGMERLTGFSRVAEREGIVTTYPSGLDRSWADGRGGTPADRMNVDDVKFLAAAIDDVSRHTSVDADRVFVTGMSNGGFMAARLACDLASRVAAVGVVAATLGSELATRCRPAMPVPIVFMNGEDDPLVPFNGGELTGGRGLVLSAADAAVRWARWNGCSVVPSSTTRPDQARDGTTVRQDDYTGCRDGANVRLFRIAGAGHTWPGGLQYLPAGMVGRTSHNLDANEALWEFFKAHSRHAQRSS
jgi:polyhydroxybutyrate depolymerase